MIETINQYKDMVRCQQIIAQWIYFNKIWYAETGQIYFSYQSFMSNYLCCLNQGLNQSIFDLVTSW